MDGAATFCREDLGLNKSALVQQKAIMVRERSLN